MSTRRSRGLTVLVFVQVLLAAAHSYHGTGMPPQEQAGGPPTPIQTPAWVEAPEPDRSRPLGKLEAGEWVSTEWGGVRCEYPASPRARQIAATLQSRIVGYVAVEGRDIGFAVHDHSADVVCTFHPDVTFEMASIVKVATVASLLNQRGLAGLSVAELDWARAAIVWSDNDAQDLLWGLTGGEEGLQMLAAAGGLTQTTPGPDGMWGLGTTTAADQLRLMDALVSGTLLGLDETQYLLGLMRQVVPEQTWGIIAQAPPNAVIAVKNGWMDVEHWAPDGRYLTTTWTVNSIGYIQSPEVNYTLAILSSGHDSEESGRNYVEEVVAWVASVVTAD